MAWQDEVRSFVPRDPKLDAPMPDAQKSESAPMQMENSDFAEALAQKMSQSSIPEEEHKANFLQSVITGARSALSDILYSGAGRLTGLEAQALGAPELRGLPQELTKEALAQKEYNAPIPTPDWYRQMNPNVGPTIPAGLASRMAAIYGIPARMEVAKTNLQAQQEREIQRQQFRQEMAAENFQRQRNLFYEKTGVTENNAQANKEVDVVRKASADYTSKLDAIAQIRTLLEAGNLNADKQAGGALASVYNKGRLSDFDYKIATMAGSALERLRQGIATLEGKGGFTPAQRQELIRTADALETAINRRQIEMWDEAAQTVSAVRKTGGGAEAAVAAHVGKAKGPKKASLQDIIAAELAKEK